MACGGFSCSRNSLITLNVLYILVALILITVSAVGKAAAMVTDLALVGSIVACGVLLFIIALIGLIGAIKHHQVLLFFYMVILFLLFLLQFSLACACLAMNDGQKENLAKHGWSIASNDLKSGVQYHFNCCGFSNSELNVSDPMGHPLCDGVPCCSANEASGCCRGDNGSIQTSTCPCQTCLEVLKDTIKMSLTVTGGVGLFFSFTEIGPNVCSNEGERDKSFMLNYSLQDIPCILGYNLCPNANNIDPDLGLCSLQLVSAYTRVNMILGVWLAMRYRNQKDPRANPSAFL